MNTTCSKVIYLIFMREKYVSISIIDKQSDLL